MNIVKPYNIDRYYRYYNPPKIFGKTRYTYSKYTPVEIRSPIIKDGIAKTVKGKIVLITTRAQCFIGFLEGESPSRSQVWYLDGKHPTNPELDLETEVTFKRL